MLSQDDEQGQKLFWTWPLQKKKNKKKKIRFNIYMAEGEEYLESV